MNQNLTSFLEEMSSIASQHLNAFSPGTRSHFLSSFILQQQTQPPIADAPDNIFDQLPDNIKEYLFEHQKEAIDFLYERVIQPPNGFYNKNAGSGAIIAHNIMFFQDPYAHNMGLGKTTTTVAFLYGILNDPAIKSQNFKILIFAPVNVIQHWLNEFKKPEWNGFFENEAVACQLDTQRSSNPKDPHDIRRMQIGDWFKGMKNKRILILGYEIYDKMLADEGQHSATKELLETYLQAPGPDLVIFDECHRLKNNKTLNYIMKNKMRTKRRILLTGTPLENGPLELFHVVNFAHSGFLGTENEFWKTYSRKIERGKVNDATENDKKIARETEEKLFESLQEIMHRKDSEYLDSLININKKEFNITFCETEEQKHLLDKIHDIYENAIKGEKDFLSYFHNLLYVTSHPVIYELKQRENFCDRKLTNFTLKSKDPQRSRKMRFLFDIIEACHEKDEKLVVFTQCLGTLDYIEHKLAHLKMEKGIDFFRVDGSTKSKERAECFKEFNDENNKNARVFLLSIKAASVGIDLIGASRMVLFDHCFNPVHNTQATYRIFRIGQKRDVFIYRLITKNSSDDCIVRRQISKESQSKRTIDNKKVLPQYSQRDIRIKRGNEEYELITDERVEKLAEEFNDELLIDAIKHNMDGIIDVDDHEDNFGETFDLPDDFYEEF